MTTRQQQQRSRAARLLAVLALLLGLLAMHGLVGGHHAPLAAVTASAALGQPPDAAAAPAGQHGHAAPHTATASPASLSSLAAGCPDCAGHGLAVLCLAVLSAGLTLLVGLLARRARAAGLAALRPAALLRGGPPLHLRPPDLVAQLCVCRT